MRLFTDPRFVGLTAAVLLAMASPRAAAADLKEFSLTVEDVKRVAKRHVPADAETKPTPVVFAFHGHGGTMDQAASQFAIHKHWPEALVVYMQGVPTAAGNDPQGKQSGWQYNVGENGNRDVKFFDAVLADLRKSFKVDDKRIYVAGFSNGAGFTYALWSARGDQIVAVAACAMHTNEKKISTFSPKPLLQIAGKEDKLQSVAAQEKTALDVAKVNECGEGQPWGAKKNCTLYPSKIGSPVVFYVHSGGHEIPKDAPALIVAFFKNKLQTSPTGNPAVGIWKLNQPTVGESNLQITEKAGKLEVQEIGRGNAKSTTASCKDGLLVIHWEVSEELRGHWVLNVNDEHTNGTGKTVFVRVPNGFEPGEQKVIEGRKVRVVEGVTIQRTAEKQP